MPVVNADFAGAIKCRRNIDSLKDAIDTELARCKIESNEIADRIELNLKALREQASDYEFLFSNDTSSLVLKPHDDVINVIKARIADHKETEAKRLESEREKIRAEEEAKATAKVEAEARQREINQIKRADGDKSQVAKQEKVQEDAHSEPTHSEPIALPNIMPQDFTAWWNHVGSGIYPEPGMDMEEHAHNVAKAAWLAALYYN
jgi:hypothetical protein